MKYYSNFGPRDGPILGVHEPPALGVHDAPECAAMPVGTAYPVGLIAGRKGPIKTFRLVIGKEEIEGRFICDRRVFVRLGDAAEPV